MTPVTDCPNADQYALSLNQFLASTASVINNTSFTKPVHYWHLLRLLCVRSCLTRHLKLPSAQGKLSSSLVHYQIDREYVITIESALF